MAAGPNNFGIFAPNALDAEQDSLELQVSGDALDETLSWMVGYYWFKEEGLNAGGSVVGLGVEPFGAGRGNYLAVPSVANGENESNSVFFHTTYSFTDELSLTAGARYTEDDRRLLVAAGSAPARSIDDALALFEQNVFLPPGQVVYNGQLFGAMVCSYSATVSSLVPGQCLTDRKDQFEHVSWTIGVDYKISPDMMTYIKASNSFRAGGFNQRATSEQALTGFGPETVTDVELGLKADWFEGRLRSNLAYFHSFYDDMQTTRGIVTRNASGAVTGTTTIAENSGKADFDGFECELTGLLTDNWTVSANGSFLNADFAEDGVYLVGTTPLPDPRDLQRTPESKHSLSTTYKVPAEYGEWSMFLGYDWRDEFETSTSSIANSAPGAVVDAVGLWNGRISLNIEKYDLNIGLWGTNLADKEYVSMAFLLGGAPGGPVNQYVGEPRMFGIDIQKNF